jgi:hypothetical protein
MLQPLYLDVSKVDLVLHLSPHLLLHRLSQSRQGNHTKRGMGDGAWDEGAACVGRK